MTTSTTWLGTAAALTVVLFALTACSDDDGSTNATSSSSANSSSSAGSGGNATVGSGGSGGAGGVNGTGGSGGVDEIHGCTLATAEDMTGDMLFPIVWSMNHSRCILVDVGTTIGFTGNFMGHPLEGGISPDSDVGSPITIAEPEMTDAKKTNVTFDETGRFPYFCGVHKTTMQGVIYVQ